MARLEKLAEILEYSAAYTGRQVKKTTGKSFSEALRNARCTVASDMPICEIIDAVVKTKLKTLKILIQHI